MHNNVIELTKLRLLICSKNKVCLRKALTNKVCSKMDVLTLFWYAPGVPQCLCPKSNRQFRRTRALLGNFLSGLLSCGRGFVKFVARLSRRIVCSVPVWCVV